MTMPMKPADPFRPKKACARERESQQIRWPVPKENGGTLVDITIVAEGHVIHANKPINYFQAAIFTEGDQRAKRMLVKGFVSSKY